MWKSFTKIMFHPYGAQFTIACHNMMAWNVRKSQVQVLPSVVHLSTFTCSILAIETLEKVMNYFRN